MAMTCMDKFKLYTSAIGALVGYSAFVVFFCVYGNASAGFWGLVSGFLASVTFYLHLIYITGRLHVWHSHKVVGDLQVLGFVGITCGVAASIFFIFLQCYWGTPITPVKSSIVICIVWALMTVKWGFLLYKSAGKYSEAVPMLIISDELEQHTQA